MQFDCTTRRSASGNKAGDLRLGGTYVFQVRAVNSNGNGATSSASAAVTPLVNDHVYFATGNTVTMKEGGAVSKQVRLAEPLTGTDTVTLTFTETSSKITIDTDPATAGDQTEMTFHATTGQNKNIWNQGQSLYVYSAGGTGTATVSVAVKTGSKTSYIGKTASLNVTVSGTAPAKPQAKARLDHASDSGTYIVVQIADTKAAGDAGNGWALDPVQAAAGEGLQVTVDDTRRLLKVRFASAGNTTAQIKTAINAVTGFSVTDSGGTGTWQFNATQSVNLYPPHVFFSNTEPKRPGGNNAPPPPDNNDPNDPPYEPPVPARPRPGGQQRQRQQRPE